MTKNRPLDDAPAARRPAGTGHALVDDPDAPGTVVRVRVNSRSDILAKWHAAGQISESQFQAGARVRSLFERAESDSLGAVDLSRLRVDGGAGQSDQVAQAIDLGKKLVEVQTIVGQRVYGLLRATLVEGLTASHIADGKPDAERKAVNVAIHWALEDLATWWGLATDPGAARRRSAMVRNLTT